MRAPTTHQSLAMEAAATGRPFHAVAADRCRSILASSARVARANECWRTMPLSARLVLASLCLSDDNIERAAGRPWQSFTSDEQARIGAAARDLRRGLGCADWLR